MHKNTTVKREEITEKREERIEKREGNRMENLCVLLYAYVRVCGEESEKRRTLCVNMKRTYKRDYKREKRVNKGRRERTKYHPV